ncbi:tRNA methyltransferase 10 homolog C [Sphaeramia orbicularis]|uniref:tRNA methyltransferase 10 homolog C n=1 Tax=Sphaeramia orbicularis TaxID=375764 RepID=UPI00117EB2FE|nr:tRNA methyltransferase 10 homolog C [Sphaeramia orbicularis]
MLRFITVRDLGVVLKGSNFLIPTTTKRRVISFPPVASACRHWVSIFNRHFHTGNLLRKDVPLPKPLDSEGADKIDLDKWKTVMRSKAALEEGLQVNDGEEEEASDEDETNTNNSSSTLEATRDLVAMWRQAGKLVPQEITDEQLQHLAELTTKSARKKHLKYLALKEGYKKARKEKQQQKKAEKQAMLEQRRRDAEEGDGEEGIIWKNTLFLQFWSRTLDKLLGWRTAQAMIFGQPLIFDLSYEANMSKREIENTVSQLMEVEGWNRRATEPYHLHFCNLQPDSYYKQELLKRYGAETWDRLLITSTEKQHVDLFPRERLVYLTADSPNVLRTYDHSKVYIIGGLVDRSIQSGLSLANAKRLKLATARLPLDEFLHWEIGAKNLTLDQMMRIMLTFKETGKWEEALKFVPRRKHDGFHQQQVVGKHDRKSEKTFKSGGHTLNKSHKDSGFSWKGKKNTAISDTGMNPAGSRVRTSLRSSLEGGKTTGKNKMWWIHE